MGATNFERCSSTALHRQEQQSPSEWQISLWAYDLLTNCRALRSSWRWLLLLRCVPIYNGRRRQNHTVYTEDNLGNVQKYLVWCAIDHLHGRRTIFYNAEEFDKHFQDVLTKHEFSYTATKGWGKGRGKVATSASSMAQAEAMNPEGSFLEQLGLKKGDSKGKAGTSTYAHGSVMARAVKSELPFRISVRAIQPEEFNKTYNEHLYRLLTRWSWLGSAKESHPQRHGFKLDYRAQNNELGKSDFPRKRKCRKPHDLFDPFSTKWFTKKTFPNGNHGIWVPRRSSPSKMAYSFSTRSRPQTMHAKGAAIFSQLSSNTSLYLSANTSSNLSSNNSPNMVGSIPQCFAMPPKFQQKQMSKYTNRIQGNI